MKESKIHNHQDSHQNSNEPINQPHLNELEEANKISINNYYIQIRDVYIGYRTVIRPFIAMLEIFDEKFPVEILNEIRAIFQHLARCYYHHDYDKEAIDIGKQISKANGHLHRALFDCFKYACLSFYDEYEHFRKTFKNVDLSTLDNGEFLVKLHQLSQDVKKADREARKLEADTGDRDEVFQKYEDAFNKSYRLHMYIDYHMKYAVKLKHKLIISNILAELGWIVGIVSGIFTIYQFLLK